MMSVGFLLLVFGIAIGFFARQGKPSIHLRDATWAEGVAIIMMLVGAALMAVSMAILLWRVAP